MDLIYQGFDPFFHQYFEEAYRFAFLLCKHPEAARNVTFQAMLSVAATQAKPLEENRLCILRAVLNESEGYYLKKPHRLKKREHLQKLVSFPVADALWQLLKLPLNRIAAVYLCGFLGLDPADAAQVLRKKEKTVKRLFTGCNFDLHCVNGITADREAEMLDDIHLRFVERNVGFELKLRRIKRWMDKIVPYIAAAIILFCIAAVIYTANLPAA